MQGGHATCNGTVAGAMLGCKVGYSELPRDWIDGLLPKQVTWLNSKLNSLLDMMALPWQRKTSRYLVNYIKDQPLLWGFSEWCYVSYPLTNAIAGTYNKQNAISILKTCVNLDPARSKRVNKSVPSYALDLLQYFFPLMQMQSRKMKNSVWHNVDTTELPPWHYTSMKQWNCA